MFVGKTTYTIQESDCLSYKIVNADLCFAIKNCIQACEEMTFHTAEHYHEQRSKSPAQILTQLNHVFCFFLFFWTRINHYLSS